MPREIYAAMSDIDLIAKLTDMSRYNPKASFVLAQLTDDDLYNAVTELRRRCAHHAQEAFVKETGSDGPGRVHGTTVEVDSVRWKRYFRNKRMLLADVGRMIGCDPNYASVIACKGSASYFTLEKIALELGVETDEFVYAVGSDRERERVGLVG